MPDEAVGVAAGAVPATAAVAAAGGVPVGAVPPAVVVVVVVGAVVGTPKLVPSAGTAAAAIAAAEFTAAATDGGTFPVPAPAEGAGFGAVPATDALGAPAAPGFWLPEATACAGGVAGASGLIALGAGGGAIG